jgi:hypothetical protein
VATPRISCTDTLQNDYVFIAVFSGAEIRSRGSCLCHPSDLTLAAANTHDVGRFSD